MFKSLSCYNLVQAYASLFQKLCAILQLDISSLPKFKPLEPCADKKKE